MESQFIKPNNQTSVFEINYQIPSDAIIINLSSLTKFFSAISIENTWNSDYSKLSG